MAVHIWLRDCGQSIRVPEDVAATVGQLKRHIQKSYGIPREFQCILVGGVELWDDTRPLRHIRYLRRASCSVDADAALSTGASTALEIQLQILRRAQLPNFLAKHKLADLSSVDGRGRSAIHIAVEVGAYEVIAEIVAQGTCEQLNARDALLNTLLHSAARHGRTPLAKALLPCVEVVNAQNSEGCTALHLAAAYGHTEICALLLQDSSFKQVAAQTVRGRTALHCAAANNHDAVCQLLLSAAGTASVLLGAEDEHGRTALDVAKPNAFQSIIASGRSRHTTKQSVRSSSPATPPCRARRLEFATPPPCQSSLQRRCRDALDVPDNSVPPLLVHKDTLA